MNVIRDFFSKILTEGTAVSSKRFSGLVTLANVLILAYSTTIKNGETPEFMFNTLALLAGSFLGLTTVERILVKPKSYQDENGKP
jgi:hypothetical protein